MKKHVLAFVIMSISFLSVAADRYFKGNVMSENGKQALFTMN